MDTPEFKAALQVISKAVAGAIVTAIVALVARFGFQADQLTADALNVVITALLAAVAGFIGVYLAPKNKEKK